MIINTCSAAISLAKELEEGSAKFYEDLSQKYPKDADVWLSFAEENKKNIVQIERVYYGVITDAIEGCYSFKINSDDYAIKTEVAKGASYADVLGKALEIEGKIIKYYVDAAEQSKSLMADVPRAFALIAKKRDNRRATLKSLLGKGA